MVGMWEAGIASEMASGWIVSVDVSVGLSHSREIQNCGGIPGVVRGPQHHSGGWLSCNLHVASSQLGLADGVAFYHLLSDACLPRLSWPLNVVVHQDVSSYRTLM